MKVGFRRIAVLVGVLALIAASCGEDPAPPAGGNGDDPVDETVCATYDTEAGDLLAQICSEGDDPGLDRPRVPAPVGAERADG